MSPRTQIKSIYNGKIYQTKALYESFENSQKSGQDNSKRFYEKMFLLLFEKSKETTKANINSKIIELLKNTDELMDFAFKKSFQAFDYQAVYKYVTNITDYCVEVSESITKESIMNIINISIENFRGMLNSLNKLITNFLNFITENQAFENIYQFIEAIVNFSKENPEYCIFTPVLENAKITGIINAKIKNSEHFVDSFRKQFTANLRKIDTETAKHVKDLELYSKKSTKKLFILLLDAQLCVLDVDLNVTRTSGIRDNIK